MTTKYIVHKRFKGQTLSGYMNLPALTSCVADESYIYYDDKPLCTTTCHNAHQYFAIDIDDKGLERGKLTQTIQKKLAKRDKDYQVRWDKIWDDFICKKYQRQDYSDYWLWNHEFYNANVDDLRYIANLIGAKEEK